MSNSKSKKSKALKESSKGQNCFFKAFFAGVATSSLSLVFLCVAVSAFMASKDDSTANMQILSPVITVLSLLVGGFVCAKLEKNNGIGASFLCGCACLGICYGASTIMQLGGSMGIIYKTLCIAIMLVSPVFGAKLASKKGGEKRRKRRNTV